MQRSRGFTLVEMVVAFAILSISLTALYGSFEGSLARVRHDQRLSEATLIARSLLERASTEWPLVPGMRDGEQGAYRYTIEESKVATPVGQPSYTIPTLNVLAHVTWDEAAGPRHLTLATLRIAAAHP